MKAIPGRGKVVAAGILLAAGLLATGCAQHYTITLSNGTTLISRGKPRLDKGYYVYKDDSGQPQRVNAMRVREIAAD
jgi:hypothetical protein